MGFQSKTYSLSDEVVEAIEKLREKYGSPNKGLRAVLLNSDDAVHDGGSNRTVRASVALFKGPLLKPSEKK